MMVQFDFLMKNRGHQNRSPEGSDVGACNGRAPRDCLIGSVNQSAPPDSQSSLEDRIPSRACTRPCRLDWATPNASRGRRPAAQHCPALFGGLDQVPVCTLDHGVFLGPYRDARTVSHGFVRTRIRSRALHCAVIAQEGRGPQADWDNLSRGDPAGIGVHRHWASRTTSAASPARSSTNPACPSASAACEAVRLVTPRARASSARVRGPSPTSRHQASGAREEA